MIVQGMRQDGPNAIGADDAGRLFVNPYPVAKTQFISVAVGEPYVLSGNGYPLPFPMTVKANPGSGGTLLVEYRISSEGEWFAWPPGDVSTSTPMILDFKAEALRFTASVSAGSVELA